MTYFHITFYLSKVGYNRADLAIGGFGCDFLRNKLVECSPAVAYGPTHWFTRAVQPLPPATNLFRIFDFNCWLLTIATILTVALFFAISSYLGTKYGLKVEKHELPLIPFRYVFSINLLTGF